LPRRCRGDRVTPVIGTGKGFRPRPRDRRVRVFPEPGLSPTLAGVVTALAGAVILVTFIAVSAIFFIWLERKVAGRIQDRLGPTRVGGKFGWLQTLADGLKLLAKEDLIPQDADKLLFRLAPYIAFCGAFMAFLALPFGNGVVARTSTSASSSSWR